MEHCSGIVLDVSRPIMMQGPTVLRIGWETEQVEELAHIPTSIAGGVRYEVRDLLQGKMDYLFNSSPMHLQCTSNNPRSIKFGVLPAVSQSQRLLQAGGRRGL